MNFLRKLTGWCGPCLLCLILIGTAIAQSQSQTQVARFDETNLQTWAMFAQVHREYQQLKLTSDQVDSLFYLQRDWIEDSGLDHRGFLTRIYETLDDKQDRRGSDLVSKMDESW